MVRDTVLIIDDDPDFRELVTVVAESVGLLPLEAPCCASALPLLIEKRGRIASILLDYCMPGMAPVACADAIRGAADPGTPIILVTAAVDARERASELHLAQWLSKPFPLEDLERLLAAAKSPP